jgi:CheY-like chemotaxis protein
VTLLGDPLRLSQAVSNLLTNAAKYTDPAGRIRLHAQVETDGGLAIAVEDSGVGLEPAIIPQLFQMFMQVGGAVDRSEGGLGIGLALVKGLIELHGGTVEATSPGPGRGSTFTLRLPAAAVARDRAPVVQPNAPATATGGARVLVVDDNRDAADSLAAVLRLAGHQVWLGYGGAEALFLAQAVRPDAMVLDIGMPGMSGYDVAREIRAQDWASDLLLIAVTGFGQSEDRERALAAGFTSHCTKPVDPAEVERQLAARASAGVPGGQAAPDAG